MPRIKPRKFPDTTVILLAILVGMMLATWFIPTITFDVATDPVTGITSIDESTVLVSRAQRVFPWQLPGILVSGVESVLSTLVLISVSNAAFAVLNASGIFTALIQRLCRRFYRRETRLLFIIYTAFSLLGLIVIPHCFVAFVPLMVNLSLQLGYDPLVGLAMVLFGATTASMTGPFNAVTAMCQERVGLPIFSGFGVRLLFFAIFHLINAAYLIRYANRIKRPSDKSSSPEKESLSPEQPPQAPLRAAHIVALVIFAAVLLFIACGSIFLGFSTEDISGVFLAFGILIGPVLGFSLSDTMQHFIQGIRASAATITVISLAGAVTVLLTESGLFSTLLYYSSSLMSLLPNALVPTGMLILVGLMNCLLPSGPAKGVMLMPLLGPLGQMSGVSLQTSVLTYTLGDSFSNYLLPYDSTTATYLSSAQIPYRDWVRFVFKLFLIWHLVGSAGLTVLYFVGYGPY